MAHKFFPGQAVRPVNNYGVPHGYGWYSDDWLFRVSTESEAPQGVAIRVSESFKPKIVIHLQVCQYEEDDGKLKMQKQFACWQWEEDFEADSDR